MLPLICLALLAGVGWLTVIYERYSYPFYLWQFFVTLLAALYRATSGMNDGALATFTSILHCFAALGLGMLAAAALKKAGLIQID